MRSYHKKQCLDMLAGLDRAHDRLQKIINRDADAAAGLLCQCQQDAISLGNFIEKEYGEGTGLVGLLENYCELVYQLSVKIGEGAAAHSLSSINVCQWMKSLTEPLSALSASIQSLPTEREVVFLPYKAAMWDSLEAEWKRAAADPNTTALVIPIPYYDKNPDGSIRQLHCEVEQYPSYVPVIDYEAYDIESRHPEKIYIHNAYDQANYVTSVLPQFYSSKLKEFTDDLVYIPYFVLDEVDPANSAAVEGMAHFVALPGVINAHHVIVQSEAMRQVYINVMSRYTGEGSRSYWERKISGQGSPKFERVENLTEADYSIPEDWKKLIYRADGTKKKVILYNTGVTALLENNDQMLEKIKWNFGVFKEHREQVTLLWRPHPLIEATLTSMRPMLWEDYRKIVEGYRSEGWGIYDDTAELDRAIAVSDAYYGDGSSVVQLYKKTGKPIMIQNCAVR